MNKLIAATAALLCVLVVASPVSAASWRPIQQLASSGHLNGSDSLAVSGNVVHVIYTRGGLLYQRSANGGRTFAAPVRLAISSPDSASYTALSVAAYGHEAAILYAQVVPGTSTRSLYVKVSSNDGRTWGHAIKVATLHLTQSVGDGSVAITSRGFFVAATASNTGQVTFWRSTAPGSQPWQSQVLGTTTNRDVQNVATSLNGNVALAAFNNRVNVFWAPDGIAQGSIGHIVQRRSSDAGATFFHEEPVAANAAVVVGARPAAVSVYSTTILVAYQRSDGRGAVLRSTNAGASWATFVATPSPTETGNPDLQDVFVGYGGAARLVYASYTSNASVDKLWVRTSSNSGATWSPATQAVGATPVKKNLANVVATSGGMAVVYGRFVSPSGGVEARAFN